MTPAWAKPCCWRRAGVSGSDVSHQPGPTASRRTPSVWRKAAGSKIAATRRKRSSSVSCVTGVPTSCNQLNRSRRRTRIGGASGSRHHRVTGESRSYPMHGRGILRRVCTPLSRHETVDLRCCIRRREPPRGSGPEGALQGAHHASCTSGTLFHAPDRPSDVGPRRGARRRRRGPGPN